jgi:hypothetical protein
MGSTPSPTPADRREGLIARADEELAHAHELITSADEQIARLHEQLARLDQHARRGAAARRLSRRRRALRGLACVLLAAVICLGAFGWRSPYGDAARMMLARSAPHLASALSPQKNEPVSAEAAASHAMYLELTRHADLSVGQVLSFAGKVIQSAQSGQSYELLVNVTRGNFDRWQDTIHVDYTASAPTDQDQIVGGDLVSVRGTLTGIRSDPAVNGETIAVPSVVACVIKPGLGNIPECPAETATAPAKSGD